MPRRRVTIRPIEKEKIIILYLAGYSVYSILDVIPQKVGNGVIYRLLSSSGVEIRPANTERRKRSDLMSMTNCAIEAWFLKPSAFEIVIKENLKRLGEKNGVHNQGTCDRLSGKRDLHENDDSL